MYRMMSLCLTAKMDDCTITLTLWYNSFYNRYFGKQQSDCHTKQKNNRRKNYHGVYRMRGQDAETLRNRQAKHMHNINAQGGRRYFGNNLLRYHPINDTPRKMLRAQHDCRRQRKTGNRIIFHKEDICPLALLR